MKTCRSLMLLVISICVLVGCGQQPAVPTTVAPTASPGSLPTLTPEPTEAPTTVPIVRPTFPPTWTPTPEVREDLPTETPMSESANVQPAEKPTLEVCGPFRDDPTRYSLEYSFGSDVPVAWIPVENAVNYRVRLLDENGDELTFVETSETSYTFGADLFELGMRYGWSVYPIDVLGQQMCYDTGSELIQR